MRIHFKLNLVTLKSVLVLSTFFFVNCQPLSPGESIGLSESQNPAPGFEEDLTDKENNQPMDETPQEPPKEEPPKQEPPKPVTPMAPQNVQAVAISSTRIDLSWRAPANAAQADVQSYKIFRNGSLLYTATANTLSYRDEGLSSDTTYSYQLLARSSAGLESARTASVNATTLKDAQDTVVANILNEDFEGRGQNVSNGTPLNATNSFARTNDGRPVTGWFQGGASNPYSTSYASNFVRPQFDSTYKVVGAFSARFGIQNLGQTGKSGSFYHYMTPTSAWKQLHSSFYWRFNAEMAAANAYPALGSFWEGNGREDLTYLRFVSTGSTTGKLQWETADGAWAKSSVSNTYEYKAGVWYQVFIHLDAQNHRSTLVVKDMNGNTLQTTTWPMQTSSGVGTYEFGALQANPNASFGPGAAFWFDDLKLSTTPLLP